MLEDLGIDKSIYSVTAKSKNYSTQTLDNFINTSTFYGVGTERKKKHTKFDPNSSKF